MARKLKPEEEYLFNEVLQVSDPTVGEVITDPFLRLIRERRDAALVLTPELDAWFRRGPQGPRTS
jgi:hypothetical protein